MQARQEANSPKRKAAATTMNAKRSRSVIGPAPFCDCGCGGASLYTWGAITLTVAHIHEYTARMRE